jgi:hypothetical protein
MSKADFEKHTIIDERHWGGGRFIQSASGCSSFEEEISSDISIHVWWMVADPKGWRTARLPSLAVAWRGSGTAWAWSNQYCPE